MNQEIKNALQQAQMLAQIGQFSEADRIFHATAKVAPDLAQIWHLWGQMLTRSGNIDAARKSLQKAVDIENSNPAYLFDLGQALAQDQRYPEAEKCLRKVIRKAPKNPSAHNELGTILKHQGHLDLARGEYLKALKYQADFVDALYNLGLLYQQEEDYDQAIRAYRKALGLAPDAADIHSALGITLHAMDDNDDALLHLEQALEINGQRPQWRNNLCAVLVALGRFSCAMENYRIVIEQDPDNATAWRGIAMNKKFSDCNDPDILAIANLLSHHALSQEDRIGLGFGLGKAYDDCKGYDQAFPVLAEANRLKRTEYNYSSAMERRRFDAIKHCFDPEFFDARTHYGYHKTDIIPVFVLGMPRSGTSLVEQIMASHPKIHGCGEIHDLHHAIKKWMPLTHTDANYRQAVHQISPTKARNMAMQYLKRITQRANGEGWICNKLPFNFLSIGWIRLLFPHAKVIHCQRDPVDICLSIFQKNFNAMDAFAYDLSELGIYQQLYTDLMTHWETTLPGFLLRTQYEDLVQDQERYSRRIIESCGLDWDPACLSFHETQRSVKTASFSQVRKPVYNTSMQRWRRYEHHLEPLLSALKRPLGTPKDLEH